MGRNLGYGATNAQMMRNQLRSLNEEGMRLIELTRDDDVLPGWVVAKVITALDGITTARQYLQSKIKSMKKNPSHTKQEVESVTAQALRQARAAAKGAFKYGRKAAITAKKGASLATAKAKVADLQRCGAILGLSKREIDATKAMKKAYSDLKEVEMRWYQKIKNPSRGEERIKYRAWPQDGGPKYRIVRIKERLEEFQMPSWSGREMKTFERWEFKEKVEEVPFIEIDGEVIFDHFFSLKDAKKMIKIIESDPNWDKRAWETTEGTQVQYGSGVIVDVIFDDEDDWDM